MSELEWERIYKKHNIEPMGYKTSISDACIELIKNTSHRTNKKSWRIFIDDRYCTDIHGDAPESYYICDDSIKVNEVKQLAENKITQVFSDKSIYYKQLWELINEL